jgi:hypothetical protein
MDLERRAVMLAQPVSIRTPLARAAATTAHKANGRMKSFRRVASCARQASTASKMLTLATQMQTVVLIVLKATTRVMMATPNAQHAVTARIRMKPEPLLARNAPLATGKMKRLPQSARAAQRASLVLMGLMSVWV